MTAIDHSGTGGSLLAFTNSYDANGNRTSVTKNGGTPESYTLDSLNRLTGVTYADGTTQSYTYDANGNRLTKTQGGATTTYTYNNGDQLTSDGSSTYGYDANGNLTARGSDMFTWDYSSRMTGATVGGTATTYTYDAESIRTSVTTGVATAPQLWDRICNQASCEPSCGSSCEQSCGAESGAPTPLLVDDGASSYLWADGLVAEVGSTGARMDDHGDGLGSIRARSNSAGVMASSADYDVFGTVRASTGPPGAFRFTAEQWDSATGLEFLRARYYDPTVGRLTSPDTMQPNAPGTQGWNLYAYVANNPATWADPSGNGVGGYLRVILVGGATAGGLRALGWGLSGVFALLACHINPACHRLAQAISEAAETVVSTAIDIAKCAAEQGVCEGVCRKICPKYNPRKPANQLRFKRCTGICAQNFRNCIDGNPVRHKPICKFGLADNTGR